MAIRAGFHTPFPEQLDFFRRKLNLPSAYWDDLIHGAHDRGFMVAGATKADLLDDLRQAVDTAIAEGKGLAWFQQEFPRIVAKHGWTGWTGEGSAAGTAWRSEVIYKTNMRSSYSAGRWKQLTDPQMLQEMPYWRYVHSDSVVHPRPLHLAWGEIPLILPATSPWWDTHFPPNGWGCQCTVQAVSERQLRDKYGKEGPDTPPDDGTYTYTDRYGETHVIPNGIDYGWGYAPGADTTKPLRELVADKMIRYPDAIATALSRDVTRYINATEPSADFARRVVADRSVTEPLWLGFVENFLAVSAAAGQDVKGYLVLLPADVPRHVDASHAFDGGSQRPATPADYALVWQVLAEADSLRPGELTSKGLSTVVAVKEIAGEVFRCVFDVRPGKKNRALALLSLVIKK